jgi:hypothetical protein
MNVRGTASASLDDVTQREGMMKRLHNLLLALATASLVATASCGRVMHLGSDEPAAQVIFTNQSLDQADVYTVIDAGVGRRLGTVFAGRTDTLDVPVEVVSRGGTVNIVARLLARSFNPSTGPLVISSGEVLKVTLPSGEQTLTVLPGQ